MENDRQIWWKVAKNELYLLRKYWLALVWGSFLDSFFSWFKLFVLTTLSLVYSILITIYRREGFTISDFVPPNFGWGLILALVTMFLYRLAVNSVKQIHLHKVASELYTPKDIEIEVFHPDELDTRLSGLIVKNLKGQSIKATATVRRLTRNNRNIATEQHSFKWESENNYAYATLEHGKPELLVVERRLVEMPKNMTKGMTRNLGSEQVREINTRVILETNTEPYLELLDGDKCVIEIEFWFIINNLYLKDYILQCRLENNKGKLKIEKIRQWMN